MHLENLSLTSFKNYKQADFTFINGINCLVGSNGSGKTNVLDAINICALTKSYFQKKEQVLIHAESSFFIIKSLLSNRNSVFYALQEKKKSFKFNGIEYEKTSEHIGKIPIVFTTPYDTDIIRGSKEIRRKFFDNLLSQLDAKYLKQLIHYNKLHKNRNALLKQFKEEHFIDTALLETYDDQLIPLNQTIKNSRMRLMEDLLNRFKSHYQYLTDNKENVDIKFSSNVSETIDNDFKKVLQQDLSTCRTNIGIHKDEYRLLLEDHLIRQMGSQGQQKSFVLALQLAKFSILEERLNQKPILLLDDIFDKLDEVRISKLIKMMSSSDFGQVFITDASVNRVKKFMNTLKVSLKIIRIENGNVISQDVRP